MAYTRTKYESDEATIHAIRLSPEKAALAGTAPVAAVNSPIKTKISKSNREYGIRPRGVIIAREFGTAPDTFQKYAFIPKLTEADFGATAAQLNETVTYDGASWTIVSRIAEDY
jgi:hypothetical protein